MFSIKDRYAPLVCIILQEMSERDRFKVQGNCSLKGLSNQVTFVMRLRDVSFSAQQSWQCIQSGACCFASIAKVTITQWESVHTEGSNDITVQ